MKFNKTFTLTAIAAAAALAASSASAVLIDPDGPGGDSAIQVDVIDFAPGNVIATCEDCFDAQGAGTNSVPNAAAGSILNNYGHSTTSALFNGGVVVSSGDFGSDYEWTISYGFLDEILLTGPGSSVNGVIAGESWFQIYFDPATNGNNLTGQGFDDGTLILSGTFNPFGDGSNENFTSFQGLECPSFLAPVCSQLDGFGGDDYPDIETVSGTGGGNLNVTVDFSHDDFFLTDIETLSLPVDTLLALNYDQVDPSSCFDSEIGDGTGANFLGAGNAHSTCGDATTGSIGDINGLGGPNIIFQTDASAAIPAVPEPTTLALLGLGMAGLGYRRRKARA